MMKYDVIIAGGGTAGCACAYTSGKLGLKTLVIEKNSYLGGAITSALVVPAMKSSNNAINTDFYNLLYKKLEILGGAITYCDGNKGWLSPELTKIALDELLISANVDILFETEIAKISKNLSTYNVTLYNDNTAYSSKELFTPIETRYIVDATGDAKICKKLNCEFLDNKNKIQPMNLRFIMSGVNTNEFASWLLEFDSNRDISTACTVNGNVYCSTAYTWDSAADWALRPLFKQGIADGIITEEDSNYFQIFSIAGTPDSIGFNAPRLISSHKNRTDAYIAGRASILRISEFCKKYLPGFKNAYISSIANTLGVRVSDRVKGKYIYTKQDLIEGKTFKNPVVISNYPIDIHSDKRDSSTLKKVEHEYQLPIESLIAGDNLFVIGRCISADFDAISALRIIPSCFSMGEGLAKYLKTLD